MPTLSSMSRRGFLKQTLAWSATAAAAQPLAAFAPRRSDPAAAHALILGDWGYLDKLSARTFGAGNNFAAQGQVARGMRHFAQGMNVKPDALCAEPKPHAGCALSAGRQLVRRPFRWRRLPALAGAI